MPLNLGMSEKQITHASEPNILQRGTQGMPEVERMRMLYNMIDKVRADLRAIVMTGTHG
jgi:hypothetical protein